MKFFKCLRRNAEVLTLVIVIVGFIVANNQLRTMKESIYCTSLSSFQEDWVSDRIEEARFKMRGIEKIELKHYLCKPLTDECKAVRRLSDFYEFLGWAVDCKHVHFDDIKTLFGSSLLHYWRKFRNAIEEFRKHSKDGAIYQHFENFANRYQMDIENQKEFEMANLNLSVFQGCSLNRRK